ncbi:HNH endonuclease [Arthrobacter sp. BF1]|uniref:HNH endonuclease n=1 Tax=Arthrobacter sp. BF1 TaxID=2821145 RepID=UPI00358E8CC3
MARTLYANNPWICGLCRKPVQEADLTADHIVPVSLGGSNELSNLQISHAKCNYSRGNRTIEEFQDSNTDNSGWLLSLSAS